MMLLAALLTGVFAYLAVGYLVGEAPELRILRRPRPPVGRRRLWLTQAGVALSPAQFRVISLGLGAVTFVLVAIVTRLAAVALVPAVAVAVLPWVYFARRRVARLREIQEAWPDGLRDLIMSIGSGMSLARSIEALAKNGPAPLRQAFERFPLLSRTLGVVPALEVIKEQISDPTSDRVIEVLIVAHERGGPLVQDILQDLARVTSRDLWTAEQIRSASLEQKINARVVFVLPWIVLVALTASSEPFRRFYGSTAGLAVVGLAAVASAVGMMLVVRLGREPEEPRVFGASATRRGTT
jgi:tight adherence protein B